MTVLFRPLQLDDAPELFACIDRNRAFLRAWLPWLDGTQCVEDSRTFIQSALDSDAQGHSRNAFLLQNGKIVGTIALRNLHQSTWDFGYWLSEEACGQGIVTQAVQQLLAEYPAQKRFMIRCRHNNHASAAVAKRCGFVFSHMAENAENAYGQSHDMAHYVLER